MTFICVTLGDDLTQITWLKGGAKLLYNDAWYTRTNESLQEGMIYSTLEVCGVGVRDASVYSCVASNRRWNDAVNFELQVAEKGTVMS